MLKLRISAIITILLGIISIGWVIYDYIALTDIAYEVGEKLVEKRRMVTLGFIPILLFHFAFFITMYFLFDFLKSQKNIIKEHRLNQAELQQLKAENIEKEKPENLSAEDKKISETSKEEREKQ